MRRILVVPSIGHTSVVSDDAYREFYALSQVVRESNERAFWYFVVPSWVRDGLLGHDRLRYIHLDSTRDVSINSTSGFPSLELARQFSRRGGRYIVDAVLTDCVFFGAYLKKLLSDPFGKTIPVILRDHGEPRVRDVPEEWMYLACSYASCFSAVRSDHDIDVLSRFISRYINPSMSRLFLRRCIEWKPGYDIPELEGVMGKVVPEKRTSMFIGGDFSSFAHEKRDLLSLARRISITGVSDVVLSTPSASYDVEKLMPSGDNSFVDTIHSSMKGLAYYRDASRSLYFVSIADRVGCHSDFDDEIARVILGQVGIFPAAHWITSLVGRDYPLLYNAGHMDEAYALAVWITQNREEALRAAKSLRDRFVREYDMTETHPVFFDRVGRLIDNDYEIHHLKKVAGKKKPFFNLVYDISQKLGDSFALDVFLDVLEEHATWLKPWGRKGTLKSYGDMGDALPTLYDIREMLDNLGWIDLCDNADIRLKRVRNPLDGVIDGKGKKSK